MGTPSSSTLWRLNVGLVILGAASGALASIPLTYVAKLMSSAPQANLANYVWNMAAFGIIGAFFSPLLAWIGMRRVPLWRAFTEPAVGGILGCVVGYAIAPVPGFFLGAAAGVGAAAWRLNAVYRDRARIPAGAEQSSLADPAKQ